MKRSDSYFVLLTLFLGVVCGCTDTTLSGGVTTLTYRTTTVLLVLGSGGAMLLSGVLLVVRVLPRRWRELGSLNRRLRRACRFAMLPVVGLFFIVLSLAFSWYRIEIGPDYLAINNFPNRDRYTRDQITGIELMDRGDSDRLRIRIKDEPERFVNETEVGSESFQMIVAAAQRLVGGEAAEAE